jgi:hypothetical protein
VSLRLQPRACSVWWAWLAESWECAAGSSAAALDNRPSDESTLTGARNVGSRTVSYYLRVFCTSSDAVPLRDLFDWAASNGVELGLDPVSADTALDEVAWTSVAISYAPGRAPLIAELDRDEELVAEETEEFVDLVEDARTSSAKRQVLDHLRETSMVVAVRLPTSDADDATYDAAWTVLRYFAERRAGLAQADGEGFYEGDRLILATD